MNSHSASLCLLTKPPSVDPKLKRKIMSQYEFNKPQNSHMIQTSKYLSCPNQLTSKLLSVISCLEHAVCGLGRTHVTLPRKLRFEQSWTGIQLEARKSLECIGYYD